MIRISTIFVAFCMVLIAASLGLVLYSMAGISGSESAVVTLAALTILFLFNAVSLRLRDRADAGTRIADLSRGTADLARQVTEFGRRLAAVEGRMASINSAGGDRLHTLLGELNELGGLVKQLATSVASHEEVLTSIASAVSAPADKPGVVPQREPSPSQAGCEEQSTAVARLAEPAVESSDSTSAHSDPQMLEAVKSALDQNRIDIYLQPIVTLPQRKVRFYEAVTRLRDERNQILAADDFIGIAEAAGLIGRIDHSVMLRCVQVLRRLSARNKEVGIFCNMAAVTLADQATFMQCLDFLDTNRALAPSLVLEFKQSTFNNLGPIEAENLAALAQRGYRFSIDHVTDLSIEPRELADRGVRFIKVPAALLLDQEQTSASDIHSSDLSGLLSRFGIDLIAERIEGERAVVDLLDYDIRLGQGFLFAPPRPLRPEATSATAGTSSKNGQATNGSGRTPSIPASAINPARAAGNAALARRAVGPA